MPMRIAKAFAFSILLAGCATQPPTSTLPEGFVFLKDIAPSIRQDMRYAGKTNFMGRRVNGYEGAHCILTGAAAQGLKRAQDALARQGMTLVVFDCYRPARAVADFMAWTQTAGPVDPVWRPKVPKDRLVPDGYIAARSGHSRGSTVDLGIARLRPLAQNSANRQSPCKRVDRNTVDLGTPFDCFDPASATASLAVSVAAQANRETLLKAMTDAGFRNYSAEWWHYTLINEPFSREIFDFVVPKNN
jgi:zinc D-Ala-D-Ala dipeptidase